MGCCSTRAANILGDLEYSVTHGEEIVNLLKSGDKEESQKKLVEHFNNGWRPFHASSKDGNNSFFTHLLSNKANLQSKFVFISEKVLLEKHEGGTVLDHILKNEDLMKVLNDNHGNEDHTVEVKDDNIKKAIHDYLSKVEDSKKDFAHKFAERLGIKLETKPSSSTEKPQEVQKEASKDSKPAAEAPKEQAKPAAEAPKEQSKPAAEAPKDAVKPAAEAPKDAVKPVEASGVPQEEHPAEHH